AGLRARAVQISGDFVYQRLAFFTAAFARNRQRVDQRAQTRQLRRNRGAARTRCVSGADSALRSGVWSVYAARRGGVRIMRLDLTLIHDWIKPKARALDLRCGAGPLPAMPPDNK